MMNLSYILLHHFQIMTRDTSLNMVPVNPLRSDSVKLSSILPKN